MREDRESRDLEGAAYLARMADDAPDDRPSPSEYMDPPDECPLCGYDSLAPECPRCGYPF